MAKIDISKIDGYEAMSAEEKIKALEAFDVEGEKPDYTGYIKKDMFDKTASELAEAKRKLKERMSEEEQSKAKEAEERKALEEKYNELLHKTEVSEHKAKLLAMGYDEALAGDTAEAMANGELDKVFENQKKHLASFEKKIKADVLKDTPKPQGGAGGNEMTLEKLRAMSPADRLAYSEAHPDEYKTLYGGN